MLKFWSTEENPFCKIISIKAFLEIYFVSTFIAVSSVTTFGLGASSKEFATDSLHSGKYTVFLEFQVSALSL